MIWQIEPNYQHQNFNERRYQTVKLLTNTILDRTGDPAYTCLLALLYVWVLLNYKNTSVINGIPINKDTGSTTEISPLLRVTRLKVSN